MEVTNEKVNRRNTQSKKKMGCASKIAIALALILLGFGVYVWSIWSSVESTANKMHVPRPESQIQLREKQIDLSKEEPFSILLLGIDTGEFGRVEKGRSDIIVVATVNPKNNKMTLTSIPRDTYTEIVGNGSTDKINHAYSFGGAAMSANSVQKLLDIPIDYTVSADMSGFEEIVDAIGGITITPSQSFKQSGYTFEQGVATKMNGKMALAYTRNRYDTGGDYSRQDRARELVMGVIQSAASLDNLMNYQNTLDSLSNHIKTDMTYDEMMTFVDKYRSVINNVDQYQLQGSGQKIDGVYYEIIHEDSLNQVKQALQAELEIS